jgi:mycothiol synthase
MAVASLALDHPSEHPPTYDEFVGKLFNPVPGFGEPKRWVALVDDSPAALFTVYLPGAENRHIALVEQLIVDPALRCRGIGTLLLRTILPYVRAADRTAIEFWAVASGGPGERWARGHGFRVTHAVVVQELLVGKVDRALWDVAPPLGYRLASWRGRCPDRLVESFALARTAITDAPMGDAGATAPEWTVDRVRESEHELAGRGIESRVCVAVTEVTGAVAGLTMVERHPHRDDWVYQADTAVLERHRGRGLGRCVKASMSRSLVADMPDLRRVLTHTAITNTHMIATNRAVGYTDAWTQVVLTHDVGELARTIGIGRV